mmetsp:Transcript_99672/g.172979  ORF Transcript_99672/g.172979 Transcript_99672/m.172979 type:complete len:255 (-) Transcript_99672:1477-2241(-)
MPRFALPRLPTDESSELEPFSAAAAAFSSMRSASEDSPRLVGGVRRGDGGVFFSLSTLSLFSDFESSMNSSGKDAGVIGVGCHTAGLSSGVAAPPLAAWTESSKSSAMMLPTMSSATCAFASGSLMFTTALASAPCRSPRVCCLLSASAASSSPSRISSIPRPSPVPIKRSASMSDATVSPIASRPSASVSLLSAAAGASENSLPDLGFNHSSAWKPDSPAPTSTSSMTRSSPLDVVLAPQDREVSACTIGAVC